MLQGTRIMKYMKKLIAIIALLFSGYCVMSRTGSGSYEASNGSEYIGSGTISLSTWRACIWDRMQTGRYMSTAAISGSSPRRRSVVAVHYMSALPEMILFTRIGSILPPEWTVTTANLSM